MLETYRSLLSIPHARAFVLAGFVARLSISMRALGAVLMISQLTGSYGWPERSPQRLCWVRQ
jgi:hypothetical protein